MTLFSTRSFLLSKPKSTLTFVALTALQIVACATEKVAPPPQPNLASNGSATPKSSAKTETSKSPSAQTTAASMPFVTQFESALAKRDCSTIQNLQNQLIAPPDSYSNSAMLAIAWCAHQKNPQDKELLNQVQVAIEQSLKLESPLFDAGFLETLRAESFASAGDYSAARAAYGKALSQSALQFMTLVSGQAIKSELQGLDSLLTGGQAVLLKEIRSNLADPLTQASALNMLDDLLSQIQSGSVRDKLLAARLKIFSAFELSFASQLATLEEFRLKNDSLASEELTARIRRIFPSRAHQARIDSIVGPPVGGKSQPGESLANQCPPSSGTGNTALNDKGDVSADRVIQVARLALNEGKPGEAVEALDSLPDAMKNDKTRSLRREASEAHVRDLRRKANELYQKGTISSDKQAKLDSLAQCKQILENILTRYPETDSFTRVKIQKFLNSVSENIVELRKAQLK